MPEIRSASLPEEFKRGMHVVITGSGSALPDPVRGGASQAVIVDGVVLLFDCGRMVTENLLKAGVNPATVSALFFTHHHFDHIGSYGYFVISSWIAGRQDAMQVYGPQGTVAMSDGAIHGAHESDVGFVRAMTSKVLPDVPVTVQDIEPGVIYEDHGITVTCAETEHYSAESGKKSLAYRVTSKYGSVYVSGDCTPTPDLIPLASGVDLLIHECAIPDPGMAETVSLGRGKRGHCAPTTLSEFGRDAGVKRILATHLPPFRANAATVAVSELYYGSVSLGPDVEDAFRKALASRFSGEVGLAHDAQVITIAG
ncbi:MBL fold metallo-hydrolase [Amycolatopsis jejuensis]|uniref:MBL fold metallo-hydrolase n=1 Tax=Amycolatopsis jejuensis TaxID=330084 RepID=UPI000527050E|nr:MBL fold metallo-hydrolase [Amycolatopsis jejuensis]